MDSTTRSEIGKVAILFANLKGNLGDFAILQAMLGRVATAFPGRQLEVFPHPLVAVDAERLAEFERGAPGVVFAAPTFHREIRWHERLLMSSPLRRGTQARLIECFAAEAAPSLAKFADYEAVFIAGGDQWSGRELGLAMFGTLTAIQRVNPNIYAFPFSLKSSIRGLYAPATLRRFFGMLRAPLIARDSLTMGILAGLEVPAVEGSDCVFSLLGSVGHIAPAADARPGRVLFVVKGQEEDLAASIQQLLDHAVDLELFTTCPPEDDRVYQKLAVRFGLRYHRPSSWQQIIAEFRASSLVITNRLHGLILGSLAATPLLPVADRKKALAFVRDAGMPHSAPRSAEITAAMVAAAIGERTRVLAQMDRYAQACRHRTNSPVA